MFERLHRGKRWVTHAWGLEGTYIGISRGSILSCFYKMLIHDSFKLNNSYAKLSVISSIMKFYDPV